MCTTCRERVSIRLILLRKGSMSNELLQSQSVSSCVVSLVSRFGDNYGPVHHQNVAFADDFLNIRWGDVQQPFAGDLIPAASTSQTIGTAFNERSANNS